MTTFVKNEQGRPEAAKGAHDDCVMARAINCYIAHQQSREIVVEDGKDDDEDEDDMPTGSSFFD